MTRPKRRVSSKEASLDRRFIPVAEAFADDATVSRKRVFSSQNVLTVGGKIFAMLVGGRLVVKLPKPRVDELVTTRAGKRFEPGHGRLMKEWVAIPKGRLDWIALAKEAHRYVGRLVVR